MTFTKQLGVLFNHKKTEHIYIRFFYFFEIILSLGNLVYKIKASSLFQYVLILNYFYHYYENSHGDDDDDDWLSIKREQRSSNFSDGALYHFYY